MILKKKAEEKGDWNLENLKKGKKKLISEIKKFP